ncbi:GntR family transcriptional regulator [Paenarthrobacter sp. RAF54_2]|uniref:GntR family transcriptional regulator n=2 Tax=Micrococcaceae TaxID=1268 RepID=UPI003F9B4813
MYGRSKPPPGRAAMWKWPRTTASWLLKPSCILMSYPTIVSDNRVRHDCLILSFGDLVSRPTPKRGWLPLADRGVSAMESQPTSEPARTSLARTLAPRVAERTTLVDQVAHRIRREIILGTLDPGRHLVEKRLAEDLSVSRGTVREALTRLAATGLVEFSPGSGNRVRYFSDGDIAEIGEVFAALEGRAAMHAVLPPSESVEKELRRIAERMRGLRLPEDVDDLMRLDREFHGTLMNQQPKAKLVEAWQSLESLLAVMMVPIMRRGVGTADSQADRHLLLVDAAMSGEPELLIKGLEQHYYQE